MNGQQLGIEKGKVNVPVTIQYGLTFLLLTFLCYEAHETFHHLTGAALCGGFGNMTFTVYEPRPQCAMDFIVTLAGPALSFVIAWLGAWLLVKRRYMLLAFTLIFASFAHLRFPLPLMRSGDEWSVVRSYVQQPNEYLLAGALFLLALPPLVYAFRSMANRRRLLVFSAAWLMPFFLLFFLPVVDGWLFAAGPGGEYLSLLGVPVIILVSDLAALLLFLFVAGRLLYPNGPQEISPEGLSS